LYCRCCLRRFAQGLDDVSKSCAGAAVGLGHLFDDGPRNAGGLRFCINSSAMELGART
jgi:peptide methionine sulfoxide reductase MsrB